MTYKTDYHIHTTFSDGRSDPEKYIAPAVAAGIREIGFSEHLSLFKENQDWSMTPDNVDVYLDHISELAKKVDSIIIRRGLEIDYIPGKEKETGLALNKYVLDYRIGSVHYLGEKTVDLGPEFYEGKNIDRLYKTYFEYVILAASSGLFDKIGRASCRERV